MSVRVIFNFPRFYLDVEAFGREFYLNLGNFKTNVEEWKFGPLLYVEKTCGDFPTETFTLYNFQAGFNAFTREFILLCLGTCRYYDKA